MSGLLMMLLASAQPSGFTVAAETRNFVFYVRDASTVEPAKSQRFLDDTAKRLGATLEGRQAYYRYAWAEEVAFAVGSAASGASGAYMANGEIHSSRAFDAHEIVHRVAFQIGDPGALFQEGLAVELGDDGRYGKRKVDDVARRLAGRLQFRTLADRFESLAPEQRYPLAGSFVRFLIQQHGLPKLAEFFRAVGQDPASRDAQFAKVIGSSLDEAGARWLASLQD